MFSLLHNTNAAAALVLLALSVIVPRIDADRITDAAERLLPDVAPVFGSTAPVFWSIAPA